MPDYQPAQRTAAIKCLFIMLLLAALPVTAATPDIMLATVYRQQNDVTQFWVSEKLDGVRARWDGKQFISRGGNVFIAPAWFVQQTKARAARPTQTGSCRTLFFSWMAV